MGSWLIHIQVVLLLPREETPGFSKKDILHKPLLEYTASFVATRLSLHDASRLYLKKCHLNNNKYDVGANVVILSRRHRTTAFCCDVPTRATYARGIDLCFVNHTLAGASVYALWPFLPWDLDYTCIVQPKRSDFLAPRRSMILFTHTCPRIRILLNGTRRESITRKSLTRERVRFGNKKGKGGNYFLDL